jgi:hypothetical protein
MNVAKNNLRKEKHSNEMKNSGKFIYYLQHKESRYLELRG